jgi:hypothetical protein
LRARLAFNLLGELGSDGSRKRDCGGDDSTEYNDNSGRSIPFQIDASGATKHAGRGFKTTCGRRPTAAEHNTWKIDVRAILYFQTVSTAWPIRKVSS